MTESYYIFFPLVAALIGWFTNYLAIKMLFRPRKPISLFGISIVGLVPRRQLDIARSIGETIESDLLTHDDLKSSLNDPAVTQKIEQRLVQSIEEFMSELATSNPMIGMFMQGDMALAVKTALFGKIKVAVPELIESLTSGIEERLNIKSVVEEKIASFDMFKLEEVILRICRKELKSIEALGGILGFLIGTLQVVIIKYQLI